MAIGEEKINILTELAGSYQELPPGERIAFATQAIALSEELHDQKSEATAYNHLGVAYNNVGNSERSLECFFKALQIMKEIDDPGGITYSYICIGQAHNSMIRILSSTESCIASYGFLFNKRWEVWISHLTGRPNRFLSSERKSRIAAYAPFQSM